jgi:dihydrofolate reductase
LNLFQSPLPNRLNIVVTRNTNYNHDGIIVCKSIDEALTHCKNDSQPFIIGGGEIYSQTIELVDKIELTRVYRDYKGDAFFPEIPEEKFKLIKDDAHQLDGNEKIQLFLFNLYKKII